LPHLPLVSLGRRNMREIRTYERYVSNTYFKRVDTLVNYAIVSQEYSVNMVVISEDTYNSLLSDAIHQERKNHE
jgi:hypothetical protein